METISERRKDVDVGRGYDPSIHVPIARGVGELNGSKKNLAAMCGVPLSTIYVWGLSHRELREAFEEGRSTLRARQRAKDQAVEFALYNRAVGFTYEAEKLFTYRGEFSRITIKVHKPPDVRACEFWLTNRRPDRWKYRSTPPR